MRILLHLFLVITLTVMFSCKKTTFNKHFTITVKDEVSNRGIENCEVIFYQDYDGGLYFSEVYDQTYITDENGQVEFSLKPFKKDKASDIKIFAQIQLINNNVGHVYSIGDTVINKSEIERKNNIEIVTNKPPGYIIIDINEVEPHSDSILSISWVGSIQAAHKCYGNSCSVQYKYVVEGDKITPIIWRVYSDDSNDYGTVYQDSIYVSAFETINYIITF